MNKTQSQTIVTGQTLIWKKQTVTALEHGGPQKIFVRLEDGSRELVGYRSLQFAEIELTQADIIEDVQPVELSVCQEMFIEACKPRDWNIEPELTITQKLALSGWITSAAFLFGLITHVFYANGQ